MDLPIKNIKKSDQKIKISEARVITGHQVSNIE